VGLWTNASGALLDDFGGGTGSGASLLGAGKVLAKPEVLAPTQQTTSEVTKYYYFGGQRIALRTCQYHQYTASTLRPV
jgi:hypothetical protein